MESNENDKSEEIDTSPGTLVWVRRQNGSWWPGVVLGTKDIPKNQKIARTRTPIKLLGRMNGGLEWFDLEKSVRVKSFRCGEYDGIIKEAKDNALSYVKPADDRKYVRRENAILHALELESVRSFKKNHKCSFKKNNTAVKENTGVGLQSSMINHIEVPPWIATKPSKRNMHKKKRRNLNDSDDGTTNGMKRTRDLQDLASGIVEKKEPKGFSDNCDTRTKSNFDNNISNETLLIDGRSCSSIKRKRSHVGPQTFESLKKKCRSKSLSEVNADLRADSYNGLKKKESQSAIDNSLAHSGTSCKEAELNGCLQIGKDASGGIFECNDVGISECLIDVPVMGNDLGKDPLKPSTKQASSTEENQSNHRVKTHLISELTKRIGKACSSSASTLLNDIEQKIDMSTSDWHTKGKRNARHLSLNKNIDSESIVDRTFDESLKSYKICNSLPTIPPHKIRLPSGYRVMTDQNSSDLYDVEISVQSNKQGERVPLVSLMSKFYRKAIVGHPILVEISLKRKGKKSSVSHSRKIRRLSSFVTDHKFKGKESKRISVVGKTRGSSISCVPLRLVFSRLEEALKLKAK